MREYITFSLCWDSGEADLTPKSKEYLERLVEEGDLWGVDVLSDMYGIMEHYYGQVSEAWRLRMEKLRERAIGAANDAS